MKLSTRKNKTAAIAAIGFWLMAVSFPCFAAKVEIAQTEEQGYTFRVNGKPFLIKGIIYNPTPIGKGYDYDFFSDENKPWLIDGKLMKEAGINCVRIYSCNGNKEKVREFIRDMYEKFGIYTVVGDWLGLWNHPPANYADENVKKEIKQEFIEIVEALKDEEGLLMWILGNENNYTFSSKPGYPFWTSPEIEKIETPYKKQLKKAEIYYSFVNDVAKSIKEIDSTHPVVLSNGETGFLDIAAKVCEDIDILGIILYRGKKFGNLFNNVRNSFDRPIILTEFGCDSFNSYKNQEDQDSQAKFLLSQWKDLYKNTTLGENPQGNVLGGFVFEWNDEWWKYHESYSADWATHNTEAGWSNGSYFFDIRAKDNLNMNEEWFGIVALSEEKDENGLNKRLPRKSYYTLKDFFSSL